MAFEVTTLWCYTNLFIIIIIISILAHQHKAAMWDSAYYYYCHCALDSDVYWPVQLCCVRLQDLEPTTNGRPITRTVARFIQAPAQDPLVCSSTRQCWLQLWVSCTVVPSALLWLYSEFGADCKCPDSTRLDITGSIYMYSLIGLVSTQSCLSADDSRPGYCVLLLLFQLVTVAS